MNTQISDLLALIDQSFDHRAWHGTYLKGSLKGVDLELATWRPKHGAHPIWEIVLHVAYWKYVVRRRLVGGTRKAFPYRGTNWIEIPDERDEKGWMDAVKLLIDQHGELRRAIAGLNVKRLHTKLQPGSTVLQTIMGIASHDLYHTGQIQLIKSLYRKA
jgi:hypothetical protein